MSLIGFVNVERDKEIVALWHTGVRSKDIAARLGVSANVIAGVVNRARLRGDIPPSDRYIAKRSVMSKEKAAKDDAARQRRQARHLVSVNPPKPKPEPVSATVSEPTVSEPVSDEQSDYPRLGYVVRDFAPPAPASLKGVPLTQAKPRQCRAVLPDVRYAGLAVFCGQTTQPASSFCPTHHKLYYNRVPPLRDRRPQPVTKF